MRRRRPLLVLISLAFGMLAVALAIPAPSQGAAGVLPDLLKLPEPQGDVLLEVSGRVAQRSISVKFDRAGLEAIGRRSITTTTAWNDGAHVFEGVLARDVMHAIGADDVESVRAIALNEYEATIPTSDFAKYNVLFAWSMDGKQMTARDKGPLWIVYPKLDHAELRDELYDARWVWQLNRLILP